MKSLFLSTYSDVVLVAVLENGIVLAQKESASDHSHSSIIIPTLEGTLKELGIDVHELNEIIVVNGPGSFTGVRLGVTVAKTLAYTLNIPIKTITSIEALGYSIDKKDKLVTIDDPKGKYIGRFINNCLEELIYYKEGEAIMYINETKLNVYNEGVLNIQKIYEYVKDVKPTPAHAVKAVYIKGIDALNGK